LADLFLQVKDGLCGQNATDFRAFAGGGCFENPFFFFQCWVVNFDIEHEAVLLRFRERIGAFLLDWILCGNDEEGFRELRRFLSDGDFLFLHGLQECGLGLWGCAVDFVGQQNIGEHRTFNKPEFSATGFVFFQYVGAGNVGWHQVWSELDAAELHVEQSGDGADDKCLGEPWDTDKQAVAAGEDGREDLIDHGILSDDHLVKLLFHHLVMAVEFFEEFVEVTFFCHGGCS
jgi:hypothetical protein